MLVMLFMYYIWFDKKCLDKIFCLIMVVYWVIVDINKMFFEYVDDIFVSDVKER